MRLIAAAKEPPPPPPRVEGSGEFAFVNSNGNADSTSLGILGEVIYRPDRWLVKTRGAWVRLESDEALEAQPRLHLPLATEEKHERLYSR